MDAHTRAILAQLTADEQKFYEREPQRSWVSQMRKRLQVMPVAEAAKVLRENMSAFRPKQVAKPAVPPGSPPKPSPTPRMTAPVLRPPAVAERDTKPANAPSSAPAATPSNVDEPKRS